MDDFIKMATSQLGIGESQTRSATGGILGMLKGQLGEGVFGEILEKLPGADALVGEAEAGGEEEAGGGMLGGLMEKAGSLLGGGAGGAASLLGMLSKSGLDASQSGSFVTMFIEFVKDKLGDDLFAKIADYIPGVD